MKKLLIPAFVILVAALCSCEEEIVFTGDEVPSKLVLFSMAEAGKPLTVTLSQSLFFMEPEYVKYYVNKAYCEDVAKARRSVRYSVNSGATTEMYLVQEPDLNAREDMYYYGMTKSMLVVYGSNYSPKPGDHIRIDADVEGFGSVSTEVDVPVRPHFEVVSTRRVPTSNGELYTFNVEVTLTLHDDGATANFYRLEPMRLVPEDQYGPSDESDEDGMYLYPVDFYSDDILFMPDGVVESVEGMVDGESPADPLFTDSAINGRSHTFKIRIPSTYLAYIDRAYDEDGNLVEEEWVYEETLYLSLSSLSESSYRYARSIDNVGEDLLEIFGEPVQLYNNVKGGIGCFAACSTVAVPVDF